MKNILAITLLAIIIFSCSKDCGVAPDACSDTVPDDIQCAVPQRNWFYNAEKNSCTQIRYSACKARGFDTKKACEACKCH
jgi:hypothetical protein